METGNYTKLSAASSELRDSVRPSLDFELPDGDRFASVPPLVPLALVIQRSRQLRAWFPNGIRTAQERWAAKSTDQFQL